MNLVRELKSILSDNRLRPHFQPILDLGTMSVHGFEGLIRGPSDTVLHSPINLFSVARASGHLLRLDLACIRTLVGAFLAGAPNQRLFVNISPDSLSWCALEAFTRLEDIRSLGIRPEQIVIELTECEPTSDYKRLLRAADLFRKQGFSIAIDDLGEGFSSLRLWSELRPEYVKIDQHFIQGVSLDPVKLQFLRSIQEIAHKTGARIVAEGVETESDLAVILELGVDLAQGYLLGRPHPNPVHAVPLDLARRASRPASPPHTSWISQSRVDASRLMVFIEPFAPETPNLKIHDRFLREPDLLTLPIVKDGTPVGLINRYAFLDAMARHFSWELYGKRACETFMNRDILVVDHRMSIHELSKLIVESDPRHILHGFAVTRGGAYAGMGSGHDLMREITRMQIHAARYANPLTQLPGNVPISEHLDELLHQRIAFHVCYCDLDHFKPFNDVYGYQKGDEVICWTGSLLSSICDPERDFLGHIGGDDFLLVMLSEDWEERCRRALSRFEADRRQFFCSQDLEKGGYESEDRLGRMVFHPLLSMSIGAVRVPAGAFASHHEISAAAAQSKKQAKAHPGCSLFVERRRIPLEGGAEAGAPARKRSPLVPGTDSLKPAPFARGGEAALEVR